MPTPLLSAFDQAQADKSADTRDGELSPRMHREIRRVHLDSPFLRSCFAFNSASSCEGATMLLS